MAEYNAGGAAGRTFDDGQGAKLLRPENRVAKVAALAAIAGGEAPTEAEHNATRTAINAILDALVLAGIMKDA